MYSLGNSFSFKSIWLSMVSQHVKSNLSIVRGVLFFCFSYYWTYVTQYKYTWNYKTCICAGFGLSCRLVDKQYKFYYSVTHIIQTRLLQIFWDIYRTKFHFGIPMHLQHNNSSGAKPLFSKQLISNIQIFYSSFTDICGMRAWGTLVLQSGRLASAQCLLVSRIYQPYFSRAYAHCFLTRMRTPSGYLWNTLKSRASDNI